MRTQKQLYAQTTKVYSCELARCTLWGSPLGPCDYLSRRKTVQTMATIMQIAYRPKRCPMTSCPGHQESLKSGVWQQIAPLHGTYGFDVIATIGWQRQTLHQTYGEIQAGLAGRLQISQSQVRYLYSEQYLPLIACHERTYLAERGLDGDGADPITAWYKFEIPNGHILSLAFTPDGDAGEMEVFLFDTNQGEIWSGRAVPPATASIRGMMNTTSGGTYYVQINPHFSAGGNYSLELSL